jgi:hypothetical protein
MDVRVDDQHAVAWRRPRRLGSSERRSEETASQDAEEHPPIHHGPPPGRVV